MAGCRSGRGGRQTHDPLQSVGAAPECRAARPLRNEIRQSADCGKFRPCRFDI
ncbi:unnamed protein product [Acidocella sp. C78]|nr:unnamed protein product [Acidocella sp. C78]